MNYTQLNESQKRAVQDWQDKNNPDNEYEYQDNDRYADPNNQQQLDEYYDAKFRGCCGSVDVELTCDDGTILLYGFNYGH